MHRLFWIFFCGFLTTLVSKAIQNGPIDENYQIEEGLNVDYHSVSQHFEGVDWLENRMMSEAVNLNQIYQQKTLARQLPQNTHIRRYQKSYSTWIEERVCNESPYIDKPVRANMTSRFGYRTHPVSGERHIHAGIDFRGHTGTPVLAGASGVVKAVRRKGAYGKTIIIDHGNSFTTLYGHLSGYAVREGQWVNLGQTIGFIGRTGRATGPHLHFEVRCHNVPLNPIKYLGKMGQVAEVKFKKNIPSYKSRRSPASFIKRDPNYYTRMINLQKLRQLKEKNKKF